MKNRSGSLVRWGALLLALILLLGAGAVPARAETGKPRLVPQGSISGTYERGTTVDARYSYTPAYVYETLILQTIDENGKVVGSSVRNQMNESAGRRTWTVHIATAKFNPGKYKVVSWVRVYYENAYHTYSRREMSFELYGWKETGGKWSWVREDGSSPASEWMEIDGKKYYFTAAGYRKTGWLKKDGNRYYFGDDGVMATRWQTIGGKKYYFTKDGTMVTGWQKLGGKYYYFLDGVMLTGKKEIDGVLQKFDRDGVWQGEGKPPKPLPLPKKVTLNLTTAKIKAGETVKLRAETEPEGSSPTVTWTSSKPEVATVSTRGVVKGVKAGTAVITVRTANGKTATCEVKVTAPDPESVKLDVSGTLKMKVGEKRTLKATLLPDGAKSKLTWSTSDKKVVTVSKNGGLRAVGKGTATVTVKTANGKTAKIKIRVQ